MTTAEDVRMVAVGGDDGKGPTVQNLGVTAHECSPDRTVFTEKDNTDGWIATDTTVELRR